MGESSSTESYGPLIISVRGSVAVDPFEIYVYYMYNQEIGTNIPHEDNFAFVEFHCP